MESKALKTTNHKVNSGMCLENAGKSCTYLDKLTPCL